MLHRCPSFGSHQVIKNCVDILKPEKNKARLEDSKTKKFGNSSNNGSLFPFHCHQL